MFGSIFGGAHGVAQNAAGLQNQNAMDQYNAAMQRAQQARQAQILGMEEKQRSRTFFNVQIEMVNNGYMVDFGDARLIAKNLGEVAEHVISTIAAAQLED